MVNFIASTPSPNIGDCSKTSKWQDNNMISDCKKCLSKEPEYGKSWFYCDGSCLNQYELDGSCSYNSLVAKNINQCDNPCIQTGEPPNCGDCSDNFDCPKNQECKLTTIIKDNMEQKNCGVCTPSNYVSVINKQKSKNKRFNVAFSIFIIFLILAVFSFIFINFN